MDILSAAITLFLVMDPLGNIPFFLAVLKPVDETRRSRVIGRELLIAYVALLLFLFAGQYFLNLLGLKQSSISIAGGIILFLIAIRMIFPVHRAGQEDIPEGEPLVVPLAIPGVAGPSCLATVLLLAQSAPHRMLDWWLAITGAWAFAALILLASPLLFRLLRERGLIALERLMGMILVTLSVQMFLDGVAMYLRP